MYIRRALIILKQGILSALFTIQILSRQDSLLLLLLAEMCQIRLLL